MNLEVWGDSRSMYRVSGFASSLEPANSYVTLFWLGPKADVVIPLRNIKIPAHQDVKIDSGESLFRLSRPGEWVAINTLEPLHSLVCWAKMSCGGSKMSEGYPMASESGLSIRHFDGCPLKVERSVSRASVPGDGVPEP